MAKRLLDSLTHPFVVNDREVLVTASIGIAIYPRDGQDGNVLIAKAETALRRAQEHGGKYIPLLQVWYVPRPRGPVLEDGRPRETLCPRAASVQGKRG